ncbi:hypothetical protein ACOSP7_015399 [Xanthoceras sorbifolium]
MGERREVFPFSLSCNEGGRYAIRLPFSNRGRRTRASNQGRPIHGALLNISISQIPIAYSPSSSTPAPPLSACLLSQLTRAMSLSPLLFRSLVRFVASLVREPAASVTTLLYYSQLLPPNVLLERMLNIDGYQCNFFRIQMANNSKSNCHQVVYSSPFID